MIILDFPAPPPINHIWRVGKTRAGKVTVYKNPVYTTWLQEFWLAWLENKPEDFKTITGPFDAEILICPKRKRDADSSAKAVLDAAQANLIIRNDSQCRKVTQELVSSDRAPSWLPLDDYAAMTFDSLPKGHYGAILADPPWRFEAWSGKGTARAAENHYQTLTIWQLAALPVHELAAENCVLFLWTCWPQLEQAIRLIDVWGFTYKTCAFNWTKAHAGQVEMFQDDIETYMGLGYWTRANTEPCLLATRGTPKRLNADVRQAIISPKRQHSRKPEGVHASIQRLVAGPYLELFARQKRPGWDVWGNETDKFTEAAE